ncbi:hypothetical protein GDO81_020907 [Engystomops pustulosus]|uniref:Uncharacterized protein n=1 Tax=Engystomops pustulosus TaxID=76066 RepID=A0AAV6Z0B9_ENGPU|nr:hypothetical protein GDO81_020907 [Engystomops pustulosus]
MESIVPPIAPKITSCLCVGCSVYLYEADGDRRVWHSAISVVPIGMTRAADVSVNSGSIGGTRDPLSFDPWEIPSLTPPPIRKLGSILCPRV